MREIKFRAWDKEREEMRKVQLMDWSDWWVSTGRTWERDNHDKYGERNSFNNEDTDRHILMQYTGLKDKNGKEIYENDVVSGMNRIHEYEILQQVKFLNGCFMFGNWNAHEYFNKHTRIEVIGNIYERPDLSNE